MEATRTPISSFTHRDSLLPQLSELHNGELVNYYLRNSGLVVNLVSNYFSTLGGALFASVLVGARNLNFNGSMK